MSLLSRALLVLDGRAQPSCAVDLLCRRHEIPLKAVPDALLPPRRSQIASLAEVVLDAHRLKDPFARSVIRESISELVNMVTALKRRAGLGHRVTIHLSGGLFQSGAFRDLFAEQLRDMLPQATSYVVDEPLWGILLLAKQL
jgi:N-acetylglucosamine kinase-like BadF-type ATPase